MHAGQTLSAVYSPHLWREWVRAQTLGSKPQAATSYLCHFAFLCLSFLIGEM